VGLVKVDLEQYDTIKRFVETKLKGTVYGHINGEYLFDEFGEIMGMYDHDGIYWVDSDILNHYT
jgi:hypothetical protein